MPNPIEFPKELQQIIDIHRTFFGGFTMLEENPAGEPPAGEPGQSGSDKPGENGKEGKDGEQPANLQAVLNDLMKERGKRRDLETQVAQLSPLKDQMERLSKAFGDPQGESSTDDIVAELQSKLASLEHQNLVNEIGRIHKITDPEDIELLKSAKDREQMEKFAKRLAPAGDGRQPGNNNPRPDPSAGRGGGDDRAATSTVSAGRDLFKDRHKKN